MRPERVQALGKIPWDVGMTIGSGYDMRDLQSTRPAFDPFDLEFVTDTSRLEDFKLESQTIETVEDLQRAVNLLSNGSAPILSIGNLNAATQYLSKIKYNVKNIATVVSCTYTWPEELYDPEDPPDLTTEAEDILDQKKPDAFFSRYGQHFIAGRICQSSFHAVYTHSAATAEDLNNFKRAMTESRMSMTAATELDQIAKYTEIAKSSNITTKLQTFVNGVDDSIGLHASTHDVVPALKNFIQESHKPLPYIAILKHYSLIVPGLPRPTQSWTISPDLWVSFEQLTTLGVRARSHSLLDAQRFLPSILELSHELAAIHLADHTWKEQLNTWSTRLQSTQKALQLCDIRANLMNSARTAKSSTEWPKKWTDASKTKEWHCGLSSPTLPQEQQHLSSEIRHDTLTFSKPETSWPECQEESLIHSFPDRIILGARIESLRLDGLNGSWKVVHGGIGQSCFEIRFSTTHYRWGKYVFEVWSVDSGLYGEGELK